ncbi:unnamed protein product [Calicophoron daubneyi]|uniref:Small integral membrane protein 14 n=1 Tax=Calicophoron daubneyi TaxID=300641 RepID=A0AAV2TH78_CALDB
MGDGGDFDLCECIDTHESAMRRLLNFLRQSQAYCDDHSCVDDLNPVPSNPTGITPSSFFLMAATIIALLGIVFFARPHRNSEGKPRNPFRDNQPDPPAIS